MSQQYNNPNAQNIKKRYALLVFIKGSTAPLVLYVQDYQEFYNELLGLMQSPQAVLVEKETEGPVKRVCFISNQVAAIAIQEEQYI